MGKLIVIEGGDGSGKATQTKLLFDRLTNEGYKVKTVTFPNYDSPSSATIKMYLKGDFGSSPNDVNPYVSSTFYAVDRFASYRMEWQEFLHNDGIIIADRYTTSNMIHQGVKINDAADRIKFFHWLEDLEFNKFELPRPDAVFLLNLNLGITLDLMQQRKNKTGGETGDIHEKNIGYLKKCHDIYDELIRIFAWKNIACDNGNKLREIGDIHDEIYQKVKEVINM